MGAPRPGAEESPREVLEDLMDELRVPRERREEYVRRLSRAVLAEIATALRIASANRS